MTDLHNMSVPPRSMLTLQRAQLRGRRYHVAVGHSAAGYSKWLDDAVLTRHFRQDGAACALAMLNPGPHAPTAAQLRKDIAGYRRTKDALATLRLRCDAALSALHLPSGFGFFVDEPHGSGSALPVEAALAILAARSGPLYLPGRFEPSLITAGAVTLFFPCPQENRGVR